MPGIHPRSVHSKKTNNVPKYSKGITESKYSPVNINIFDRAYLFTQKNVAGGNRIENKIAIV